LFNSPLSESSYLKASFFYDLSPRFIMSYSGYNIQPAFNPVLQDIPPYPGNAYTNYGESWNPAYGNPTTSPYTNFLVGENGGTQALMNSIFNNFGTPTGYPPLNGTDYSQPYNYGGGGGFGYGEPNSPAGGGYEPGNGGGWPNYGEPNSPANGGYEPGNAGGSDYGQPNGNIGGGSGPMEGGCMQGGSGAPQFGHRMNIVG
jgi:hypothetical protein